MALGTSLGRLSKDLRLWSYGLLLLKQGMGPSVPPLHSSRAKFHLPHRAHTVLRARDQPASETVGEGDQTVGHGEKSQRVKVRPENQFLSLPLSLQGARCH